MSNNDKLPRAWNKIRFEFDHSSTTASGGTTRVYNLNSSDLKSEYSEFYIIVMVQAYGYCFAQYFVLGSGLNNQSIFGTNKDHNGYSFYGEVSLGSDGTTVAVHTSVNSYQPANYPLIISAVRAR